MHIVLQGTRRRRPDRDGVKGHVFSKHLVSTEASNRQLGTLAKVQYARKAEERQVFGSVVSAGIANGRLLRHLVKIVGGEVRRIGH